VKLTHDPATGCQRCPLLAHETYEQTPICVVSREVHPDYGDLPTYKRRLLPTAPAWCPLRRGPVTVEAPERALHDGEHGKIALVADPTMAPGEWKLVEAPERET
jgi:hypothetical protein